MSYYAKRIGPAIGGLPAISLSRDRQGDGAQLLDVEILPGRGMNVYQLRAFLPGRGTVPMFISPPLEEAARIMNGGPEDYFGNQSFTTGGALLIPYANRVGGLVSEDGRTVTVRMLGKDVALPANWKDTALHGLVLDKQFGDVRTSVGEDRATAAAELKAGDFGGHWPSSTELSVEVALAGNVFSLAVTARNRGSEPEPMSIGWHPYFAFPSGDRQQAHLRIPARSRALVNNYDDMAATGETVPVAHTPYDFSSPGGVELGDMFLDECFLDLDWNPEGEIVAEIIDPAAQYGLRLVGASPEIRALQVYAPAQSNFIAIEPQFNLLDPFSENWPLGVNTGMVTLKPGDSVAYRVRMELFTPENRGPVAPGVL